VSANMTQPVSDEQLEILQYMANLRARQDVRGGVEVVPEMILRLVGEVKRLRAEVAAAAERGRRRGVEEATSQCATTCDAAPWKERWGAHPPPWVVTRAVRDAIERLAPRDSAPADSSQGCPECSYTPRDSGKEG
jgi:hypothetical protein